MNQETYPAVGADLLFERWREGAHTVERGMLFTLAVADAGGGTLCISGRHYRFEAGDLLIMPEGMSCSLECEEHSRVSAVRFRPYFLSEKLRRALRELPSAMSSEELAAEAAAMMTRVAHELTHGDALSRDVCRACIAELCVLAARSPERSRSAERVCPAVAAVVEYVKEHPAERLSLGDMADMCKVSSAYLSRKFKAEMGIGFADYVGSTRLDRAEAMLREMPELSITEIAFLCGFNDSNYFSDKFKKRFGMPPIKFRKSE